MKIVFMGTPQAAVPTLKRLIDDGHELVSVWTQPDRPAGRGRKMAASPVKEFALDNNLTVHQPEKIKTKESIGLFRSQDADAAIVVAYGRILSKSYLNAFPNGCINVHFSLLPKYRGAAPVNWAIVNGEVKTGITTMKMDIGLDTGDILLQRETAIGSEENAIELMDRLSWIGADLLSETLLNLDQINPVPQDHTLATLAPIMTKEDGLIDWERSAVEISNRIRGFQPFPRSFSSYLGQKVTIWSAHTAEEIMQDSITAEIGTIVEAGGDDLIVQCGGGTRLKINELQIEGKRRMKTRDFLNGVTLTKGERLGV
ncbi:MAG: methionyl-tRNA formyltransferase [Acidobacteria bacterium]|nr:methionyl-tRNA formyltransferase [Acidobacteriota bacterium]